MRVISRLPMSLKILLENLLRNEDGLSVTRDDIEAEHRPQSALAFLEVLEGADLPKGHDPAATRTVNPATAPPARRRAEC